MLSKKLVSLIGASIISIGLVGCQSTQEVEETKIESTITDCDLYDSPRDLYTLEFEVLYESGLLNNVSYTEDALDLVYKRYQALGGEFSKNYFEKLIPAYRHLIDQRNKHFANGCPKEATMEEQNLIWCPMCQDDTIDTNTHECTKCGYIPEDWQGYLIELGLN